MPANKMPVTLRPSSRMPVHEVDEWDVAASPPKQFHRFGDDSVTA
jgi:hypothetical protein